MLTHFYHPSFEYQEGYDFEKLGARGIIVQSERVVCPTCNGNGSHFRKDLDENLLVRGIQEDQDEDSMEAYRGGAFNEVCTECNGRNVVDQPRWESLPKWATEAVEQYEQDLLDDEAIRFAECGYQY